MSAAIGYCAPGSWKDSQLVPSMQHTHIEWESNRTTNPTSITCAHHCHQMGLWGWQHLTAVDTTAPSVRQAVAGSPWGTCGCQEVVPPQLFKANGVLQADTLALHAKCNREIVWAKSWCIIQAHMLLNTTVVNSNWRMVQFVGWTTWLATPCHCQVWELLFLRDTAEWWNEAQSSGAATRDVVCHTCSTTCVMLSCIHYRLLPCNAWRLADQKGFLLPLSAHSFTGHLRPPENQLHR